MPLPPLPFGLTVPDLVALAFFFLVWGGYNLLMDKGSRLPASLNLHMQAIRVTWMRNMLRRDNRVMDSMLMGHLINSVSFFASTTVLLLAGLIGVLATAEQAHRVVTELGVARQTGRTLFELKILLLVGIFIYAFFKFTWSVRQFNYTVALVGAAPLEPGDDADRVAEAVAKVLTMAVTAFNGGLRSYYFGFAALGWFIHPWVFMAFVAFVTAILYSRQFRSAASDAVATYATRK